MHGILGYLFSEIGTDRPGIGVGGIRRTHDLAILVDGIFPVEHLNQHRA